MRDNPTRHLLAGRADTATHPATVPPTPNAQADDATAPKAAEATLTLKGKTATYADGVLTFTDPAKDVQTTVGSIPTADAFAPGHFSDDEPGDAVLSGKTAEGEPVAVVVRLTKPVYADGKVTIQAAPLPKAEPAILTGGEVAKVKATAAETVPAVLEEPSLVVDSLSATEAPADGEKHGLIGAAIGAGIGNAVCGGSWLCSATGAVIGYNGR